MKKRKVKHSKNIKKTNKIIKKNVKVKSVKPKKANLTITKTKHKIEKIKRVSTGILGLNKITQGGFEQDSTNLIVGETGSGKTIAAMQFIIEGLRKKEVCMYLTFEEDKQEFYANMKELGWDLEKEEKGGKFFFLEYTPEKVKTMLEEGGGTVETLILSKKITRVVFDSITSFILLFETEVEKREAALSLFNMLRKWNCTAVLTYEGAPNREKSTSRVLEFESDSITLLYFLRDKKQRSRYLEVLKMRGTEHSTKIYPFSIKRNGIVLSGKPISGKLY
ncbi:MAG: ATPase domain-containing protein [Candidatus Pacearchaeota archaeon]